MEQLGVNRQSAKSQLHRMVEQGLLSVERHGRVGQYRLMGSMNRQYRKIRDAATNNHEWDGRFHQVLYDVAEVHRPVRERLRHRAFAHLYGMVRPGVLISPVDRSAPLADLMTEVSTVGLAVSGWVEHSTEDARLLAATAWDLDGFARDYTELAEAARVMAASTTEGVTLFNELYELVLRRVKLHHFDPQLPQRLLPSDWPATDALATFEQAMAAAGPRLGAHIVAGLRASRYQPLVEFEADSVYARALD